MQHNPKTYVIMNEKELQSYIKELEKALILTYNDKMSWQVISQVANNNIPLDFKLNLLKNTNKMVIEKYRDMEIKVEYIENFNFTSSSL
jgi:hypothetical protein